MTKVQKKYKLQYFFRIIVQIDTRLLLIFVFKDTDTKVYAAHSNTKKCREKKNFQCSMFKVHFFFLPLHPQT